MTIKTLLLAAALCLPLPGCSQSATYRAVALDVPFALHAGEGVAIGPELRVSVEAIDAVGKCPLGHQECLEVAPPGAHIVASAANAPAVQLHYLLLGKPTSQRFAEWDIEVTRAEPWPFTDTDVALGHVAVVMRVMKHAEPEFPAAKVTRP